MEYNKIKTLANEKNISINELIEKIGISEAGFYQMIRNKSMKIDVLEKISEILQVDVNYFFIKEKTREENIIDIMEEVFTYLNAACNSLKNIDNNSLALVFSELPIKMGLLYFAYLSKKKLKILLDNEIISNYTYELILKYKEDME